MALGDLVDKWTQRLTGHAGQRVVDMDFAQPVTWHVARPNAQSAAPAAFDPAEGEVPAAQILFDDVAGFAVVTEISLREIAHSNGAYQRGDARAVAYANPGSALDNLKAGDEATVEGVRRRVREVQPTTLDNKRLLLEVVLAA